MLGLMGKALVSCFFHKREVVIVKAPLVSVEKVVRILDRSN